MINSESKSIYRRLVCVDPSAQPILESYATLLAAVEQDAGVEVVERVQDGAGRLTSLAWRVPHAT